MTFRQAIVPGYLLLCLLLGGASAAGYWANMLLQLLAVPILGWAIVGRRDAPLPQPARPLVAILAFGLLLIAAQLIPTPPYVWTSLPGRAPVAELFAAMGVALPWMPLSLAPTETIASALWLLPPLAIFFGMLCFDGVRPVWVAWILIAVTFVSILLGTAQIRAGEASHWYLYAITNFGQTVGFFANSNHLATLLLATIPFIAALARPRRGRTVIGASRSGRFFLLAGIFLVTLVGLLMNGSLAGLGLALPVLAGSALALFYGSRIKWWAPVTGLALFVAGVALAFSAPLQDDLAAHAASDAAAPQQNRPAIYRRSWSAAVDNLPLGSGLGTFAEIYRQHEPADQIDRVYINHAHNDYLELLLETGIGGALFVLAFLLWWVFRTVSIWSAAGNGLARAATIATGAILAHSMVDYPLRTAAIGGLFAACCAIMVARRPDARSADAEEESTGRPRHLVAD